MPTQISNDTTALQPGMYVRFPVDLDREDTDFRDFRIGQVVSIDLDNRTAEVSAQVEDFDLTSGKIKANNRQIEYSLDYLHRCSILPDSACQHIPSGQLGRVLGISQRARCGHEYTSYFVRLGTDISQVSETELRVGATRQDPDPLCQALAYEFHNPVWRQPRDIIVQTYTDLRSATFGIEDLVGSRVYLLAHQAEVVERVLSSPECRFMLADEVGLGKTIEACVVLKALRRRYSSFRALIIAPSSLTHQWQRELNAKFWLDFPVAKPGERTYLGGPGLIMSAEDLEQRDSYWQGVRERNWDLVIVDEAHHLAKSPKLYTRIQQLSAANPRVLILTATPIQRRATEYLSLLRLLDPQRYGRETEESFRELVESQNRIRGAMSLVRRQLDPKAFDWEEFNDDIESALQMLHTDEALTALAQRFAEQEDSPDEAYETAVQIISYISANYRIENRVIRNRRASISIDLPRRTLNTDFFYRPSNREQNVLEEIHEYLGSYLEQQGSNAFAVEYARILLHSVASSPWALLDMLHCRQDALQQSGGQTNNVASVVAAAPRQEQARVRAVALSAPRTLREQDTVNRIVRLAEQWLEETQQALNGVRRATVASASRYRLAQALRLCYGLAEAGGNVKAVLFTSWPQTALILEQHLQRLMGRDIVVRFTSDRTDEELQEAADIFQSTEACCFLLCDELGGEGRNFQIAQHIIHIDIPWTPAQLEQRIGRVDRLGRTGDVGSIPIVAKETLEHDLFKLWDEVLGLFTQSMSGLEIALEATQQQIADALQQSVRDGIARLRAPLLRQASELREAVEQERYFEEGGIDQRRRQEFDRMSERYRNGEEVRDAVRAWTTVAGVGSYQINGDLMTFDARRFSVNAIKNSRFMPPNMEEAARRSGRQRTTQIKGTFSRDVAIKREDLVFFAPGDDPWTDAVILNALECDRGRCSAVGFKAAHSRESAFFHLLFSFQVDPCSLYMAGLDEIYLLQAHPYLARTHIQLLVDAEQGKLISKTDSRWNIAKTVFAKSRFKHLGQRDGNAAVQSPLEAFRQRYPIDIWTEMVQSAARVATEYIEDDIVDYAAELADEASQAFGIQVAGWEAGLQWRQRHGTNVAADRRALDAYRCATTALIDGIRRPSQRLESICFFEPISEIS